MREWEINDIEPRQPRNKEKFADKNPRKNTEKYWTNLDDQKDKIEGHETQMYEKHESYGVLKLSKQALKKGKSLDLV